MYLTVFPSYKKSPASTSKSMKIIQTPLNRRRRSKSFLPALPATQHIKCLLQNGLFVWSSEYGLKNEPQHSDSFPVSPF